MPISQTSLIEVRWTPHKGRGIFACTLIPEGTVIERAPVLVMPAAEVLATEDDTVLSHYLFEWGKNTVALALGYGSLYNHSYSPNARYEDGGRQQKLYIAVRDIQPGEEVTINYNGSSEATDPVWFHVHENDEPTARGAALPTRTQKKAPRKAASTGTESSLSPRRKSQASAAQKNGKQPTKPPQSGKPGTRRTR